MQAFEVLAEPVRRRILELLGPGEASAGSITVVIGGEFGISQPATSQHLRVLRDSGLVSVRPDGTRRLYRVDVEALAEVASWFDQFANPWQQPLDALATDWHEGSEPGISRRLTAPMRPAWRTREDLGRRPCVVDRDGLRWPGSGCRDGRG